MRAIIKIVLLSVACLSGVATVIAGAPAADRDSAQLVTDGNNFASQGKQVEALWAYRQAAKAGNIEGAFAAGNMILAQARSSSGRERILKSYEGLLYLFCAATNQHVQACVQLSAALQGGNGIQTNLVAAYAWLKRASQLDQTLKPKLDQLVVRLEPGEIRQAQEMAREFQAGRWPADFAQPVDEGDPRLMVQGITVGNRGPLVVINNVTVAVGDTVEVRPVGSLKRVTAERLIITCREAGADYALVAIAGEANLKLLSAEQLSRY